MAKVSQEKLEELYEDLIDQSYDQIKIGYITLYPSRVLKECDPIAYRCYLSDFEDIVEKYND